MRRLVVRIAIGTRFIREEDGPQQLGATVSEYLSIVRLVHGPYGLVERHVIVRWMANECDLNHVESRYGRDRVRCAWCVELMILRGEYEGYLLSFCVLESTNDHVQSRVLRDSVLVAIIVRIYLSILDERNVHLLPDLASERRHGRLIRRRLRTVLEHHTIERYEFREDSTRCEAMIIDIVKFLERGFDLSWRALVHCEDHRIVCLLQFHVIELRSVDNRIRLLIHHDRIARQALIDAAYHTFRVRVLLQLLLEALDTNHRAGLMRCLRSRVVIEEDELTRTRNHERFLRPLVIIRETRTRISSEFVISLLGNWLFNGERSL